MFLFLVVKFSLYLNRRVFVMECHNHEVKAPRGTKSRRDEEHIMTEQTPHMKPPTREQKRTAREELALEMSLETLLAVISW